MIEHRQNNVSDLTPTILCIAESTHYLVGLMDKAGCFHGLNQSSRHTVVNSFAQAKQLLASQKIYTAVVEYQTAYDEFCGSPEPIAHRQTISF